MSKNPPPTVAPTAGLTPSTQDEIDAFLASARARTPAVTANHRGRLIFGFDATMSRQPTWDIACALQADMFAEAAGNGGLDIQLVYYRGIAECRSSAFLSDARQLAKAMTKIDCHGGLSQLGRILSHARQTAMKASVQAMVFVGDAMEEDLDEICARAGELGLTGLPAFMFQEGDDPVAKRAFTEVARLSGGAYCRFDLGARQQLADLLRAVAAYAAGGRKALDALCLRRPWTKLLLDQLR
jgi:hypothetical protein